MANKGELELIYTLLLLFVQRERKSTHNHMSIRLKIIIIVAVFIGCKRIKLFAYYMQVRPGTAIAVPCFFYSALIVCVFFLLPTSLVSKSTSSESKRYPIINRNDGDSNHQCSLCFHMEVLEVDCFTHRITIISKHYISI